MAAFIQKICQSIFEGKTIAEGNIPDFGYWKLNSRGVLRLSAKGYMPDYFTRVTRGGSTPAPWASAKKSIRKVYISEGVKNIGSYAFYDCFNLKEVVIPCTVNRIGMLAFAKCTRLKKITIPGNIFSIMGSAFKKCSSLQQIKFSGRVRKISGGAFSYCSQLSSITIPDDIEYIGDGVFLGCSSLKNVVMPRQFDWPDFEEKYGISKKYVHFTGNKTPEKRETLDELLSKS